MKQLYYVPPVVHGSAALTHSNTPLVLVSPGTVPEPRGRTGALGAVDHIEHVTRPSELGIELFPPWPPSRDSSPEPPSSVPPAQASPVPPAPTFSREPIARYGLLLSPEMSSCLREAEGMLNEWLRDQRPPADLVVDLQELDHTVQRAMAPRMTAERRYRRLFEITVLLERHVQVARAAVQHRQSVLAPDGGLSTCARLEAMNGHFNHEMQALLYGLSVFRQSAQCAVTLTNSLTLEFFKYAPLPLGHRPRGTGLPLDALHQATRGLLLALKRVVSDIDGWGAQLNERAHDIVLALPNTLEPQHITHVLQPREPFVARTDDESRCVQQCYQDQAAAILRLHRHIDSATMLISRAIERIITTWNKACPEASPAF